MSETAILNESCTVPQWGGSFNGGSDYRITTLAERDTYLNMWGQWTLDDLDDIRNNLTIDSTTSFNNGVLTLDFTLNGKSHRAYGWGRHKGWAYNGGSATSQYGSNGKVCLIVPGTPSYPGRAAADILDCTGYQAILQSPICTLADGIVHVPPCLDFNTMQGPNNNAYIRDGVKDWLLSQGKSLAICEIVELCAILKWMEDANGINSAWPAYTKRAVLGISKSAYLAMIAGVLMEPDAVVCASGVSFSDDVTGFSRAGGNTAPGIDALFDETALATAINGAATKYLFSKSNVSDLGIMQMEVSTGYTASVLNGSNVTHTTHSNGHIYPPNLGSWLSANL